MVTQAHVQRLHVAARHSVGTHGKDDTCTGCDTTMYGTGSENDILPKLHAFCHIAE